ncbi:MAG: hypothetical protein IJC45_05570 [Clostridia bacterium]|nr:hypothetical protein [Clostridia bacterium]
MLRKVISILLALCLLCAYPTAAVAKTVQAQEVQLYEMIQPKLYDSDADCRDVIAQLERIVDINALKTTVLQGVQNLEEEIDLTALALPADCFSALADYIWYAMPLAFHVQGIGGRSVDDTLTALRLSYRSFADTKEEYEVCLLSVENAAAEILRGIEGNVLLSDVEKALLLHDRLALRNEYDYVTDGLEKHTAYGALGLKRSVCQGYAMAYMYLLERVGIENYYCASDALNHGWNIVMIGSEAYHVDVTWDDRAWEKGSSGWNGYVDHDNFLRSTQGIVSTGHDADDFDTSPDDPTYDDYFWQDSHAAFELLNGELYYVDHVNAAVRKIGSSQALCNVQDDWTAGEGSYWMGNYTCLATDNVNLLFSQADGVYKLNVVDHGTQKIFSPTLQPGESVFGFVYENGELLCDINTTPNDADDLRQVRFSYSPADDCVHTDTKNTAAVAATCTSVGYTAGVYCEDCKTYVSGHTVLPLNPDAHTWNGGEITVTADCNTQGIKTYTCLHNAEHQKTQNLGFDANNHTQTRQTEPVAATCMSAGHTAGVYCEDCKTYISGRTEIPAINHVNKYTVARVDSTCSSGGHTAGEYCPDCKTYVIGYTALPLNPDAHTWNGGVITTQADCNTQGIKTYTCLHNAEHQKTQNLGFDANNHTQTRTVAATEPTASSVGYTAGVYCEDCKRFISGHEQIPMLPQVSFADGEDAKRIEDTVFINSGITADQLLSQCNDGAHIMKADGTALTAAEKPATGMILVLGDGVQCILVMPGDVDGDALVAVADARLALRVSVGLESFDENSARSKACNVNGGKIEPSDAREILRVSVGLENTKQWME